jgi:hypothetical protein
MVVKVKKSILQGGNLWTKAGELGRFEPGMMIGNDVGMTQCFK